MGWLDLERFGRQGVRSACVQGIRKKTAMLAPRAPRIAAPGCFSSVAAPVSLRKSHHRAQTLPPSAVVQGRAAVRRRTHRWHVGGVKAARKRNLRWAVFRETSKEIPPP